METATTLLPQIIEETGLNESKASIITERFADYEEKAAEWSEKAKALTVTSEDQKAEMKMAREGRLFLRQLRLNVEGTRKELKEDYLQGGRAVDHVAKHLTSLIAPIEDYLQVQETFAARAGAARKEALRAHRYEALAAYTADPNIYNLAELTEEAFSELLNGFVLAAEAKIEIARKAEETRLAAEQAAAERLAAEAKAREEQRIENERLRKEAAEKEAHLLREREAAEQARLKAESEAADQRRAIEARAAAEKAAADAALQKEREAHEALRRAAAEKAAAEKMAADTALQQERAAAEALRRAAAEKDAAERAATEKLAAAAAATDRKRLAAEKKAAAAPDQQKLMALIAAIDAFPMPTLATAEAQEIIGNVRALLSKVTAYITTKTEAL